MIIKGIPKKYSKMPIRQTLETAKQKLTVFSSCLKRYNIEIEPRRINQLYYTEPSKVYSQCQGNNIRTQTPRLKLEQCWKTIWKKDITHNMWLVELRADHSNLPEKDPVTIIVIDIQNRISSMESWTAPGMDMIKKLTAVYEHLATQRNQLLMNETHPE